MFLQLVLSGISQGCIYALFALGMTILYRSTAVLNFAHAKVFMLGAFAVYLLLQVPGMPFVVAAVLAIAAIFVLGMGIERVVMRPIMYGPHIAVAMMTVAVSYLFTGIARFFWGREVYPMPQVFSYPPMQVGGLIITTQDLIIAGITLIFVLAFFILFRFTRFGRIARAVSSSARGAALVGINVKACHSLMWGVSCMLGAVAGILVAPITLLHPDMGDAVLIRAFAAMTLGGFGHFGGAVAGGIAIGVMEQLAGGYLSTALIDIFAFLVVIVFLIARPQGFFGQKEIVRV